MLFGVHFNLFQNNLFYEAICSQSEQLGKRGTAPAELSGLSRPRCCRTCLHSEASSLNRHSGVFESCFKDRAADALVPLWTAFTAASCPSTSCFHLHNLHRQDFIMWHTNVLPRGRYVTQTCRKPTRPRSIRSAAERWFEFETAQHSSFDALGMRLEELKYRRESESGFSALWWKFILRPS